MSRMPFKAIFLDTETTGTDPKVHAVHQVSATIIIDGVIKKNIDLKFRPHENAVLEDSAFEACGLTREEVIEREMTEKDAYGYLMEVFANYVNKFDKKDKFQMYAYNAKFDKDMLYEMWNRNEPGAPEKNYFFSWIWGNEICIMALASEYLKYVRSEMENFKLITVAKYLKIPLDESNLHDAEYDTLVMMGVYDIVRGACEWSQLKQKYIGTDIIEELNIRGEKAKETVETKTEIEPKPQKVDFKAIAEEANKPAETEVSVGGFLPGDSIKNPNSAQSIPDKKLPSLNKIGKDQLHREITFGKNKGKTFATILKTDPGYIVWLHTNTIKGLQFSQDVMQEAYDGDEKARAAFRENRYSSRNDENNPHSYANRNRGSAAGQFAGDESPENVAGSTDWDSLVGTDDLPF